MKEKNIRDLEIKKWFNTTNFDEFFKENNVFYEIYKHQIDFVKIKTRYRTHEINKKNEIICEIKGIFRYDFKDNLDELKIGMPLKLITEESNKYDNFAVKVKSLNDKHIGYVDRKYSEEVFDYLEVDECFDVSIYSKDRKIVYMKIKSV